MRKITFIKQLILLVFIVSFSKVKAQNVLIIYDDSATNVNTVSLKNALTTAGLSVTVSGVSETAWNNTNPSIDGFDAVIHINGSTHGYEMPVSGQLALKDFVETKKGLYVGFEWNAYQVDENNQMQNMIDLVLFNRSTNVASVTDQQFDVVAAQAAHPILNGITSFQVSGNFEQGGIRTFNSNPSTVIMTQDYSNNTYDAVATRDFGNGHVLGFCNAANYNTDNSLSNTNYQQLILNFINHYSESDEVCFTSHDQGTGVASPGYSWGQGFVAECDGDLGYVQFIANSTGTVSAGTLNIYEGNTVSTTPIYTQSHPAITINTVDDPVRVDVTGSVNLIENNQYTFEFTVDNVNLSYDVDGSYAGGSLFQTGSNGNLTEYTQYDFRFDVSIVEPAGVCSIMVDQGTQAASPSYHWGQGFIAECDGDLDYVQLMAATTGTISAGTLNIYVGNTVSTTPIYTQSYPEIVISNANDPIRVDITGNVNMVQNDQYTFEFTVDNVSVIYSNTDVYANGSLFQKNLAGNVTGYPNLDFNFEVSIKENTAVASIVDETFNNGIKVYPNPVENTLNVDLASGQILKNVQVYNLLGKKVAQTTNSQVDVSNLSSGIYLLKAENTEGKIAIRKIIKE